MQDDWNYSLIRVVDFREDPVDDSAFGITFEILGPGNFVETVRVSFEDDFLKRYFKIPWYSDFACAEHGIIKKHKNLFIRWALVRIEMWLTRGAKEEERKMVLAGDRDLEWAKRVGEGTYKPASQPRGENEFVFQVNK
jgi:hypothetical protein